VFGSCHRWRKEEEEEKSQQRRNEPKTASGQNDSVDSVIISSTLSPY
jgi:hypothetical protein